MLLEDFQKWQAEKDLEYLDREENQKNFDLFFQNSYFGKSFMEILCDLAYQIYQLQICSEGFCDDFEGVFEDINELLHRSVSSETAKQKSIF